MSGSLSSWGSLEGGGVEGAREEGDSAEYDWSESDEEMDSRRERLDMVGLLLCWTSRKYST